MLNLRYARHGYFSPFLLGLTAGGSGLTVHRPLMQPELPAVPLSGANEGDWTCWNAKMCKACPSQCTVFSV